MTRVALAVGLLGALAPASLGTAARSGSHPDTAFPDSHAGVRHATRQELHETNADFAIEANIVGGRVRFFKEQLERALGPLVDAGAVSLTPGDPADSLVLRYLRDRLVLTVHGDTLRPILLRSGQEPAEHHERWWVVLHYEAAAPIDSLHVRNTILFETYDDQRNIMRFVRFPGETRETVTFDADQPEAVVGGAATELNRAIWLNRGAPSGEPTRRRTRSWSWPARR